MKKKIIITGGHVTPALAVIEELERDKNIEIVFVGRKFAMERDTHPSAEYELVRTRGIRFIEITTGRLQRKFTRSTIPSLLKIPFGFIQAFFICLRERPAAVVSFGGYVAVPVAICAWALGIRVLTHEQTLAPGLANRLIAGVSDTICVTHEETVHYFKHHHVVATGLPIRQSIFAEPPAKSPYRTELKKYPLLYITGGSLGAQSLNALIFPIIPILVKKFTVVHQVGQLSYEQANNIQLSLQKDEKGRYLVERYISGEEYLWVLAAAAIVVSRSGANTTFELASQGKVVLFVPLPWSAGDEQLLNAKWLETHGGAITLRQDNLTPDQLSAEITSMWDNRVSLQKKASAFASAVPRNGAQKVAAEIQKLLE